MDAHQLKCLELMEKLKIEVEKGMRQDIEQELSQKYKKELEEKLLETRLAYEAKLKAIKEEVKDMKEKMAKVEGMIGSFNNEATDAAAAQENTPEEHPPILQSVNERFLQGIVNNLDPASFLSFTQTSKKLHSLASTGSLRVPVELHCRTFIHYESSYADDDDHHLDHVTGKAVMLLHKDNPYAPLKPLSLKMLTSLNKMTCFRPIVKVLNLENFSNCGERMREVLDFIRVERIDEAFIEMESNVEDLIKRYNIGELSLRNLTSTSFLFSPYINNIKKLSLHFDDNCEISMLPNFIRTTRIPLHIENPMPNSLATELVQSWLKSQDHFTDIFFSVEAAGPLNSDVYDALRSLATAKYPERFVGGDIRVLPIQSVRDIVVPLVPTVLVGNDQSMVIIRNDLEMLRIIASDDIVSLNKMDEEEFDDSCSLITMPDSDDE